MATGGSYDESSQNHSRRSKNYPNRGPPPGSLARRFWRRADRGAGRLLRESLMVFSRRGHPRQNDQVAAIHHRKFPRQTGRQQQRISKRGRLFAETQGGFWPDRNGLDRVGIWISVQAAQYFRHENLGSALPAANGYLAAVAKRRGRERDRAGRFQTA